MKTSLRLLAYHLKLNASTQALSYCSLTPASGCSIPFTLCGICQSFLAISCGLELLKWHCVLVHGQLEALALVYAKLSDWGTFSVDHKQGISVI